MTAAVRTEDERGGEASAMGALVTRAFEGHPHSAGTEAAILDGLRTAGGLTISLVARDADGTLVGLIAFSPVLVHGTTGDGWHALGPLAILPERQRSGIGGALVREGLARLRAHGSRGCVLIGDSAYYPWFGFGPAERLDVGRQLQPYLQILPFEGPEPAGRLAFHPAFGE